MIKLPLSDILLLAVLSIVALFAICTLIYVFTMPEAYQERHYERSSET